MRAGSDAVAASLLQYVKEQAKLARESLGTHGDRHVGALESFAGYLSRRDVCDERMWALWTMAGAQGDSDTFQPGDLQRSLLARLGDAAAPEASTTLNELVAAGVSDLKDALHAQVAKAARERDAALAEVQPLREQAERTAELERELEEARAEVESLTSDSQGLRDKLSYLQEHLDAGAASSNGTGEQSKKKARRKGLEGHTGVYTVETAEGTVYEIGYPDDQGKQRWKVVGPDLGEAVALREELAGKPFEAPAKGATASADNGH